MKQHARKRKMACTQKSKSKEQQTGRSSDGSGDAWFHQECDDVYSLPVLLPSLLRRGGPIRVKCTFRCSLGVPQMPLRPPLSLLSVRRSRRLGLRAGTLRKPAGARTIEPARLCGGASAALWASRSSCATCTHTAHVLCASTLGVGLERRLRRCGGSSRAKSLLVLRIQRLAVLRTW